MQQFTVHWSPVPDAASDTHTLYAVWPSPVTEDVCFREAGFTDFGDGDEHWEGDAAGVLSRLLDELGGFGIPQLASEAVEKHRSLFQRLLGRAEPLSLREQIQARAVYDEFPDCVIAFGDSGVTLRTGNGHHIFWISLRGPDAPRFAEALPRIAGEHPLVRTDLRWEHLLYRT
ncbi:MAG TPA: hypothetical protein VLT36_12730 [Candidatus Dormibacteraeota bacterium]|nr:hypothetical protein [Candidatus Dormibacteraeota bacterium]